MRRYLKRSSSGRKAATGRKYRAAFRLTLHSLLALPILMVVWGVSVSHAQITVTDLTGRQVELAGPPKRVILLLPYYLPALEILRDDAINLVVGVSSAYGMEEFAETPNVGWLGYDFSVENAIELKPDLLIADSSDAGKASAAEAVLAKVGIPIVYVDFTEDLAHNTVRSFEILGRVFGAEERASRYIEFHQSHVKRIADRLEGARPQPQKLMVNQRRPPSGCCEAWTRRPEHVYLDMLGATNIAAEGIRGRATVLSLEYIIASDPQIFIVISFPAGPKSFFGKPRSSERAVASLEALARESGFQGLAAMRSGRVHVIDVYLTRSPLNVLMLELFAKWLHPDLFADLDPQATLDDINARFLTTPMQGPFWASLDPAANAPSAERP